MNCIHSRHRTRVDSRASNGRDTTGRRHRSRDMRPDRFAGSLGKFAALLVALHFAGCREDQPRDASLPRCLAIADFSKEAGQLYVPALSKGSFTGHPDFRNRSMASESFRDTGKGTALVVDYELRGRFRATGYAGLFIEMDKSALRKDWQAFGFEVKPSKETDLIEVLALKCELTDATQQEYFTITADNWSFCVVPISWAAAVYAGEDQSYEQLSIVLQSGTTKPDQGRLLVRRVYLLASANDIPDVISSAHDVAVVHPLPNQPYTYRRDY